MANNFGPEATQVSEVQSFTTAKEGIVKEPILLQGLTDIFESATGVLKGRRAAEEEKVVADFITQQTKIADALDQGVPGMNQQAARTAQRKNFLQAIEANPGLAERLIKAQKDVIGTSGLGQIVDEGTKEEQRWNAIKDTLVTNGLAAPDSSEEEFEVAHQELVIAQNAERIHQERMSTLDLRSKQLAVGSAEHEANQREIVEANRQYLTATQPIRFNQMKNTFEDILSGAGTAAEKQRAMEQLYTAELAKASAQLGLLTGQQSEYLTKPFEMMLEQYSARARGDLESAELESNVKRIEDSSKLLLLQDPQVAKAVAASKMFGDVALVNVMLSQSGVGDKVSALIAGHTEGSGVDAPSLYSTDENQKRAVKTYTESALRMMQSDDPETIKEGEMRVQKILESLVDDEGKIRRDPKAAFQPVKWIASTEFLNARNENQALFDAEINDLQTVLTSHYYDEVMSMVNKKFLENQVVVDVSEFAGVDGTEGRTPAVDHITTQTTSSGMTFVTSSKDPLIKKKVRDLNKSLAPVINETVHAFAHLQGRSDYGAYWDEVRDTVLAGDELQPTDEGDDLNVSDFNRQGISEEARPVLDLIDKTETGGQGDYDTLLNFSQNNTFEGTKVSEMTVDEVLKFQRGPAYRNYSRQQVDRVATPAGRFQIVGDTLAQLKKEMGLSGKEKFDKNMQDSMFEVLLRKRLKRAKGDVDKAIREVRNEWEGLKHISDEELRSVLEGLV